MLNYEVKGNGVAYLEMDQDGSSANVLNAAMIQALKSAVEQVLADTEVKGAVVYSSKRDFMLGGDLRELSALSAVEEVQELGRELHGLFRKMETGGKPFVAAIGGMCLGGGLELALACHARMGTGSAQLGLPEVTLGLLPGAGGTQRLPRMVGVQAALPLLLQGRRLPAAKAQALGLLDAMHTDSGRLLEAAADWALANPSPSQAWDRKGFQVPGGNLVSTPNTYLYAGAAGMVRQQTHGNYPAPIAILRSVYEGLRMNLDQALELELRYFTSLVLSREAKGMIRTLFFHMNAAKTGASRPEGIPKQRIRQVGILGAGMMGAGIAYVSARAGIRTILKDVSPEAAEKGKAYSRQIVEAGQARGKLSAERGQALLDQIQATDQAADMEGSDLIIEAVFEDRGLKATVTREAEPMLRPDGVFASNTSTLPITGLASVAERPEQFIGLHFFSPVDKMQLVEVILGKETSSEALALALDYVMQIGKVPIVVHDSRGFFTSRIFKTYVVEGLRMLAEGIAPALIENGCKAAGMPVGALAVADEVSLELLAYIFRQTEADGAPVDPVARSVVKTMVEELQRPGKKAEKGFYAYPKGEKKHLWQELGAHFPVAGVQPALEEVKQRILHVQAVESYRCLEEGVLLKPEDADIGSILGWGFPAYTGGVISYLEYIGLDRFVSECNALAAVHGERFLPPASLEARAKAGTNFYS